MLSELSEKYDKILNKIFNIFPGIAIWLLLTSPIWAGILDIIRWRFTPDPGAYSSLIRVSSFFGFILGNFTIVLAVYWLFRGFLFVIGLVIGYRRYRRAIRINWLAKCQSLLDLNLPDKDLLPKNSDLPKHLIVVPVGGARYDTLKKTLKALINQNYPKELIYVSLSFEERLIEKDPEYYIDMQEKIKKEFSILSDRLMIFTHPKDLPGEVIGAAANRTWGTKNAVETLEKNGEVINDFLMTSPDEDLRFHPQFLASISYEYLSAEKRNQKFYQTAVYLFTNNYWKVPAIIRAWSMSLSLPVLSTSVTAPEDRETWSCYTVNLQVMKDVNYWDVGIGIDDTTFYWRPYNYFDGDFECRVFYLPLFADAVYHPDLIKNLKAQYKQLVRWGWGVVAFPIAMDVFFKNSKIPLWDKIRKFLVMVEIIVLFKLAAILFTFTLPILGLLNVNFSHLWISHSIATTLSLIMRGLTIFIFPTMLYKFLFMPKKPENWSRLRFWWNFLYEIPLHIVILYTFAFLPFIIGPTKMMLGDRYTFKVTDKR